jgi:hypothetical protein
MATKKSSALAAAVSPLALSTKLINDNLSKLSSFLAALTPETAGGLYSLITRINDVTSDLKGETRDRILTLVKEHGNQKTDKGTMQFMAGGWVMEIQPTRTGFDAKKLEAMLRAKGHDAELCMDAKVSYVANDGKVADAVRRKLITEDEAASCKYDPSYRVMEPRKLD